MAKAGSRAKRGREDNGALIIRAPNGKLYFVNKLEEHVISAEDEANEDYPIDAEKLKQGDFACWPCKRK